MADASFSAEAGALSSWWGWFSAPIAALFGAGVAWGATRATQRDHGRRLDAIEEDLPGQLRLIDDKMDRNHREIMRMIVSLATGFKSDED
jgi:hypothetical protein